MIKSIRMGVKDKNYFINLANESLEIIMSQGSHVNRACNALSFYVDSQGSIPSIPYGAPIPPGVIPAQRARRKS